MTDKLVEDIADFMHAQWQHWQKYVHSKLEECYIKDDDEYVQVITPSDYKHWERQINTPYTELSEKEKDSDREFAKKLIDKFMLCEFCNKREKINICNTCRTDSKMWGEY